MNDGVTHQEAAAAEVRRTTALPEAARVWVAEAKEAKPKWVQVTPPPNEARLIRVPQLEPPRYLAVEHLPNGGQKVHDWSCHVKSSHDLPARLGLDMDHQTLLRLVKAGFIEAVRVTPHNFIISLTSLHEFLEDASDPEFWTREKKQRYNETSYGGEWV